MQLHPDKNQGDEVRYPKFTDHPSQTHCALILTHKLPIQEAKGKFQSLQRIYGVLSDPGK